MSRDPAGELSRLARPDGSLAAELPEIFARVTIVINDDGRPAELEPMAPGLAAFDGALSFYAGIYRYFYRCSAPGELVDRQACRLSCRLSSSPWRPAAG